MSVSPSGQKHIYQSALGISTGDIITTSYRTGPFVVVSIYGPTYFSRFGGDLVIRDYLVIGLGLAKPGEPLVARSWVNDIRQERDRWLTDTNDEVFVDGSGQSHAQQMDMFASQPPVPEPYAFDPDVDYRAAHTWRCERCDRDYNGPPRAHGGHLTFNPMCDRCGRVTTRPHLFERAVRNERGELGAYLTCLS